MKTIGIIANPSSGKDIRRLVAHATVIDNYEKVNIVERIILAAQKFGTERIYIMPDTYEIGYKAKNNLIYLKQLEIDVEILDMTITGSFVDTMVATEIMEQLNVGCIVSLGGDGTNRVIAKMINEIPLLPISTGTNNVYPMMLEGTIAGIVASVVSSGKFDKEILCKRDKRLEIYKNGKLIDIALIDAVISKENFTGTKAIWDISTITDIFVTRAHPNNIGFSSVAGYKTTLLEDEDGGIYVKIGKSSESVMAPIAPGVVEKVGIIDCKRLNMDIDYSYEVMEKGTIALDGEREVIIKEGDRLIFRISRSGPYRVNVTKTLEIAQQIGFFVKR
ncbi:MAG: hypothetical protein PWP22_9 [Thermoanaerobacter sp.]|nr:hypothetical protein [Thermoanaerobacter sp.]